MGSLPGKEMTLAERNTTMNRVIENLTLDSFIVKRFSQHHLQYEMFCVRETEEIPLKELLRLRATF